MMKYLIRLAFNISPLLASKWHKTGSILLLEKGLINFDLNTNKEQKKREYK